MLVVGDGMLHYVPFAALPLASDQTIVDRYEVVHLPSATVMTTLRERELQRDSQPKTLAVLADAVYAADDHRLPERLRRYSPLALRDLPYTRKEAQAILSLLPPEERLSAFGFDATAELVRRGPLRSYRILHFATHALFDEDRPELSGIALSMFHKNGTAQDGFLRLHELYTLTLPADLVVLSGCRTGLTRKAQGAGLLGLTHAFFYAGATRLLVSLWDVNDQATAELMTFFYNGLLTDGMSPSEALRSAQLLLRAQERWQAPVYWAGFVLEGDFHEVFF